MINSKIVIIKTYRVTPICNGSDCKLVIEIMSSSS